MVPVIFIMRINYSSNRVLTGVSDQPFGDEETKLGAYNRAQSAFTMANKSMNAANGTQPRIDFAVGLEGGLEKSIHPQTKHDELYCMAWMAVVGSKDFMLCPPSFDSNGQVNKDAVDESDMMYWSYAKTASFLLPPKICELVLEQNMELGDADDQVFDRTNSKHGSGTVGILTNGEIDRKDYYVHALKLCLIPWVKAELYLKKT